MMITAICYDINDKVIVTAKTFSDDEKHIVEVLTEIIMDKEVQHIVITKHRDITP